MIPMPWSKPDFVEITLAMEVTAYVNTEEVVRNTPPAPPEGPEDRQR
jgi:coenzyme PQQ precursor peptide PqqA